MAEEELKAKDGREGGRTGTGDKHFGFYSAHFS